MSFRAEKPALLAALSLGVDAVIEASAGTGKTYTIEHLVIDRLLRTDATIDQILVVTFTRKATAELKDRIRTKLESLLAQWDAAAHTPVDAGHDPPGHHWLIDDAARTRLEAALFGFDRAAVFTIHGFCNRVLSELAFQTGQLFENALVDGEAIFERAFREVLRTQIATAPGPKALLDEWLQTDASGNTKSANGLRALLYRAHKLQLLSDRPDPMAQKRALVDAIAGDFDLARLETELSESRIEANAQIAALRTAADIAALPPGASDRWITCLDGLTLRNLYGPKRVGRRKNATRRFPDDLSPESKSLIENLMRYDGVNAMEKGVALRVIEAFLPPVQAHLEALKLRQGLFTYDDVLDRIIAGLEGPRGDVLLGALRSRYRLALIDEFQDTDRRQWRIFRRVFGDSEEHELCVIGDPKQAIYGFRGAEVYTYLRACEELCGRDARPARKMPLDTSFRSSASLVEGVNLIVETDHRSSFFEAPIEYGAPVICGRPAYRLTRGAQRQPEPGITLWRLEPPTKPSGEGADVGAKAIGPPLANHLAHRLRQLLHEPEHRLYWDDGAGPRALDASDVMILVRNKNEAADLSGALRGVGVPFATIGRDDVFRSAEARYLRDVLAALASPGHDGRQLAALLTPFFGVPVGDGLRFAQMGSEHPYAQRLLRWRTLADEGYFGQLFAALAGESGLIVRALFGDEDPRALTNFEHLIETLTEIVAQRRMSLEDLIALLDARFHGVDGPELDQETDLRATADSAAVQILTIHKSKGLEAPIVVVYGDYGRGKYDTIELVHVDGERRFLVGSAARDANLDLLKAARRSEAQRLHYVAMTRAQVKLFLPFIDADEELAGGYRVVNERLKSLAHDDALPASSFVVEPVERDEPLGREDALAQWRPPPAMVAEATARQDFGQLYRLRARHAPLVMTSYTRLKDQGVLRGDSVPLEAEEFKEDGAATEVPEADPTPPERRLPGGRHIGRCLHEIIELIDLGSMGDFEGWKTTPEVDGIVTWALKRHGIDPMWRAQCETLVFNTVTRRVLLPDVLDLPPFCEMREIRELEFLFPIPERHHPLLSLGPPTDDARWTVGRGYVKGFIDLVFEHAGRVYWADWKSDYLPRYTTATVGHHVEAHYDTQAQLYTLGMVRLLGISDEATYEERFGGLLYVFLRGFAHGAVGEGLYFARPAWSTVCADELRLEENIPGWGKT